jgi:hypothetical protein
MGLSPPVAAAVPSAAAMIRDVLSTTVGIQVPQIDA